MHVAVNMVLRLVLVQEIVEALKAAVREVVRVAPARGGRVAEQDIDAAGLGDLPPDPAQTAFHLPLGILMRSAVIHRTAAHAEDAQPLYGHELVLDAVAALGRGLFIAPVVIAADIQHRRAPSFIAPPLCVVIFR